MPGLIESLTMQGKEFGTFAETLTSEQIGFLHRFYSFDIDRISWDFDGTLNDLEVQVIKMWDEIFGTNYKERTIDKYEALSHWSYKDEISNDLELLLATEEVVWLHPDVLKESRPIKQTANFSKLGTGVKQNIVTSRVPQLKDQTFKQIKDDFSWINENEIYIRSMEDARKENGAEYKARIISKLGPTVHLDDSPEDIRSILNKTTIPWIIFFARALETGTFKDNPRVIEFKSIEQWGEFTSLYHDIG